ncbi:hypothetical protein RFI_09274, partial [Reticulomyxa filosa]
KKKKKKKLWNERKSSILAQQKESEIRLQQRLKKLHTLSIHAVSQFYGECLRKVYGIWREKYKDEYTRQYQPHQKMGSDVIQIRQSPDTDKCDTHDSSSNDQCDKEGGKVQTNTQSQHTKKNAKTKPKIKTLEEENSTTTSSEKHDIKPDTDSGDALETQQVQGNHSITTMMTTRDCNNAVADTYSHDASTNNITCETERIPIPIAIPISIPISIPLPIGHNDTNTTSSATASRLALPLVAKGCYPLDVYGNAYVESFIQTQHHSSDNENRLPAASAKLSQKRNHSQMLAHEIDVRPYECLYCSEKYSSGSELRMHESKKHRKALLFNGY